MLIEMAVSVCSIEKRMLLCIGMCVGVHLCGTVSKRTMAVSVFYQ